MNLLPFLLPWLLMLATVTCSLISVNIYNYISDNQLSHCTRKLNATHQIGCSSQPGGSFGSVFYLQDVVSMVDFIHSKNEKGPLMLVTESSVFTRADLMASLRKTSLSQRVTGLLVFAPEAHSTLGTVEFSEAESCPNGLYSYYGPEKQCNSTPEWNPYGTAYAAIDWPFPVALIHQTNSQLKSPTIYCDELSGVNIVLGATNSSVALATKSVTLNETADPWRLGVAERAANSSILVVTKLDSRSMFERSGFGSQNVLPSISVLISVATHLMRQPAFQEHRLLRDLFFVFLDNEAYDFLGSSRLNYDLLEHQLARYTGHPLGWDHVFGVIELGEIGLPQWEDSRANYYLHADSKIYKQSEQISNELVDKIRMASKMVTNLSIASPVSNPAEPISLPPTASLQSLLTMAPRLLPHVLLTDHKGPPIRNKLFESYLDSRWPPLDLPLADNSLLSLANVLADALYRLATVGASSIPSAITSPTPGELMYCFVSNPNCSLLREFLSPTDMKFLLDLGTAIPAQSYLPIQKHELKVSHIVNVLLMALTGERTETVQCPHDQSSLQKPYVYLMGYYNGSMQCYRTMLDLASRFVLFRGDKPVNPAWMRSRLSSDQNYVRWYRSASPTVDGVGMAIGLIMIVITALCSFFFRKTINKPLIAVAFVPNVINEIIYVTA